MKESIHGAKDLSSYHAAYVPNQAAARMLSQSCRHVVKEYIWHSILSKLAQSWDRYPLFDDSCAAKRASSMGEFGPT